MEKIEKLKLRNISAQRVGSDQGDAVDGIFTSKGIENGSGSDIGSGSGSGDNPYSTTYQEDLEDYSFTYRNYVFNTKCTIYYEKDMYGKIKVAYVDCTVENSSNVVGGQTYYVYSAQRMDCKLPNNHVVTFSVPVTVHTSSLISVTVTFYVIFGTYSDDGKEYYCEAE